MVRFLDVFFGWKVSLGQGVGKLEVKIHVTNVSLYVLVLSINLPVLDHLSGIQIIHSCNML